MRKILLLALIVIMTATLGGTSVFGSIALASVSIMVAQPEDPISLDPHIGNDTHTSTAILLGFEGLLNWKDGKICPGVAESYTISPDGTVYTFNLRESKWSDGQPVTAKDFRDTYVRMLTRKDAMDLAYLIFPIKNAQPVNVGEKDASELGVKVINDKVLEITLESSYPFAAYLFTQTYTYPIRCDLAEKYGADYGNAPDKIAYNGSYVLKEWMRGDKLEFEKNPDYWDAANITFDHVTLLKVADENTRKNMFDAGEIYWMHMTTADMIQAYKSAPEFRDYSIGSVRFIALSHKATSPEKAKITQNRNFKMALSCAIERTGFVAAFAPMNIPSTGVIAPIISDQMGGKWGDNYVIGEEFHNLHQDIEGAKTYMAKACEELGYKSADEMPVFDFLARNAEAEKTFAEYFQNIWLEVLGIRTEIRFLDFAQFFENFYSSAWDIARSGWTPDYDDPFTFLDMWDSRGGWNKTGWVGESFYMKTQEANQQTDMKVRNDMFAEAEKILLDEGPIIPVWVSGGGVVVSTKIQDLGINSFGPIFDFRYAKISK